MDPKLVLVKTPQGVAEVAARGGGLSMAERRILIMVDGKRTVTDLAPLLRPGEVEGVVRALEAGGFIRRVGGDEKAAAPPAPAPAEAPAPMPEERPLTLEELKRRAVRELNDRLGPEAEIMSIRIEQARNNEDLRERLREAERLVSGLMGEAVAQEYLRAIRRR
jgi:hypothetical protein